MHRSVVVFSLALAATGQQLPLPISSAPPFVGVFVGPPAEDGAIHVRGERYKLHLDGAGAAFQPLFGPRAPRDFPLRFVLAGLQAGELTVPLAAPSRWRGEGARFACERGPVTEWWHVAAGAAQQYFTIQQPAAAGALTLRIAVDGDLLVDGDGPGVQFRAPGLGSVHYSDAVVIDARGRRLALPVEVQQGGLSITVPAAFTAACAWPLVVDPLLTTLAIDTTISDVQDAKVACDPTSGNWLVVAEEHLSATDVDIVCHRYDNSAVPQLLGTTYADNSPSRSNNPDVGIVAATQQFVIAWHNASAGRFDWRVLHATTAALGTTIAISQGIGADLANRPRIGSALTGDRFLLVMFRRNSTGTDVLANWSRTTGTNFGSLFVGPLLAPSQGTMAPGDVSTLAQATDKWVVVWRECTAPGCATQLVRMQAISAAAIAGTLQAEPTVTLATGSFADEPAIAGSGGSLLAVWRQAGLGSSDLFGVPISSSGGPFLPQGAPQNLTTQEPGTVIVREQRQPTVSHDGVRFVYGYLEDDGTDILQPHAATVFVNGSSIAWHEGHLPLSSVPGRMCHTLDLAHGAGATLGHHQAVWQQDSLAFTGDVRGAVIDARKDGPTSVVTQTGCGLPSEATIGITGTPALGRTFTVALGNLTGFPFLLVGPENISALPGCGGCLSGVDLSAMVAYGTASLTVPVPADPTLLQFRLAFQGLLLQAGGCPATLAGFPFALSDTLTIQVL
ncbi:MAG: hypothetical protein MUC36_25415 [Planctomycetes bacterium]|jgi:hypothetical protein|nr:hypothetical protein [Planctomycetota bacterium]